ncbi:unnamed protein product [Haemonchus placei]|uniref:DUF7808 domain-containing protein n=1 Tax=Haemonchus placei TaxID=6290 RepID=A0A0N4WBR3_HAEPC|nr:unnamed protein product [Haemonchus placei]
MKCVTKEGEKSQKAASPCEMSMGETEFDEKLRTAPFDPCFEEIVDGKPRSYCNVLCPGADTVYLIKRSPPNQRFSKKEENVKAGNFLPGELLTLRPISRENSISLKELKDV